MIEFKRKYSMQNGSKITKKNWQNIIAVSNRPCTGVHGVPAIETAIKIEGAYYEKWKLVYESNDPESNDPERKGYIFREVNHNGGINGYHKTPKEAVWWALYPGHISVHLEDKTTP